MKKIYLFSMVLLIYKSSYTQTSNFKYEFQTPPSPNANSLGVYGEIPVNYYNGLPEINIPIYKIGTRDIELDISLSYHAGGIRVDDEASWIGLGWSLNAGGVITRVIKNKEDEYVNNTYPDNDPDLFYFNFSGYSGKFFINKQTQVITLINQNKITITRINPSSFLDGFLVKLPDGEKLTFDIKESQDNTESSTLNTFSFTNTYITSWYLSKIESTNGDLISFEYTGEYPSSRYYKSFTDFHTTATNVTTIISPSGVIVGVGSNGCYSLGDMGLDFNDPRLPFIIGSFTTNTYKNKYLRKIIFTNGYIDFNTSSRTDLTAVNSNLPQKLNNITVWNNNGQLIRKFVFSHSYFSNQNNNGPLSTRLKLVGCKVEDVNNTQSIGEYSFIYNTGQLPDKNSYDQDYAGFYNGPRNNPIIPSQRNTQPDANYCKAASLERIVYPTMGYTIFDFGLNQFVDRVNNTITYSGGGIRINKITNYSSNNVIAGIKKYEYTKTNGANQIISSGKQIGVVGKKYDYINDYSHPPFIYTHFMYKKNSQCQIVYQGGSPIYEAYNINYWTHNEATSSSNTFPLGEFSGNGNLVCYDKVTEYFDETGENGKNEFEYNNNYATPDISALYNYPTNMPQTVPLSNGQLLKVTSYKKNGTTYTRVKENIFAYLSKNYSEVTAKRKTNLGNIAPPGGFELGYKIYSDWIIKNSETEKTYDENSQIVTNQISYNYDNPIHMQLTSMIKSVSDGSTGTDIFKYPTDFAASNNIYQTMVDKHIYSVLIEKEHLKNNNTVSKTKTEFGLFFNSFIFPQYEYLQFGNGNLEPRMQYEYTAQARLAEQNKISDNKTVFIWDYSSIYPVAIANGTTSFDIAYTSFEADGNGGWSFNSSTIIANPTSPTGKKCYSLTPNNSLVVINDVSHSEHIVSYWSKNGQYTVTGTQAVIQGASYFGWTYFEHKVANSTSVIISGNGLIDEVRIYPYGAQMTTYTYEPLVGMTSQCDANNRISYYEYDAFNRLVIIKDQDKNVIKKICYNYAGQVENCQTAVAYYNVLASQTFTRNNCTACQTGSQVTYTVQAGTYSSTVSQAAADQLAQNDIAANGQSYANTNGTCTSSGTVSVTYNNSLNISGFTASYYNQGTAQTYNFNIPASSSGTLGCLPVGTYNLTISKPGNSLTTFFDIGCRSASGTSAFFKGISVSSTTCNYVNLGFAD
jgi:hypothetical protein